MSKLIDIEQSLEDLSLLNNTTPNISYHLIMAKVASIQKERASKGLVISSIIGLVLVLCTNAFLTHLKEKNTKQASATNALAIDLGIMSNHSIYGDLYE